MYNQEAIAIICKKLYNEHIPFSSIMTSNGYYLNAATARKAKNDWHVRHVQITIDET